MNATLLARQGPVFQPLGLLLLRCAVGIIFIYHGSMKVSDLARWRMNFAHMGFPPYFAYIAGFLEVVGGALLVFGLLTRLFSLLLAGEMLTAFVMVHLSSGPILHVPGYELPMLLAGASFAIFCLGAGGISLDRLIFGQT